MEVVERVFLLLSEELLLLLFFSGWGWQMGLELIVICVLVVGCLVVFGDVGVEVVVVGVVVGGGELVGEEVDVCGVVVVGMDLDLVIILFYFLCNYLLW